MSGTLFYVTSVFFVFSAVAGAVSWIRLWEDNNYNFLRLINYLRETKRGRRLLIGVEALSKWVVILLYGITLFATNLDAIYHYIVTAFYFLLFVGVLKRLFDRDINLPSITPQNITIFVLAFLFEFIFFVFAPLDRFLWLPIIEKLLPIFIAIFVLLLSIFFDFSTDVVINQAISKIQKHKRLLTIAVVGSYGRGSTKEFIFRVLSQKYNVLATKMSFNTPLGIAKTINSDLTSKNQIFIAEMDDYKSGDIGEMSGIINPSIAVVCGINEQKMSSFGSLERIEESKYEVIESLSRDGVAIFNGNSEYSLNLFEKTGVKKFVYSVGQSDVTPDIYAINIKESKFSLSFDVVVSGKRYKFSDVKLLGQHNIENLLPAVFIGVYMGIDSVLIRKAIGDIRPLAGAMNPYVTKRGVVLIDDTYNANINSVQRAVSYALLYSGRRIMVLEPLLELGKFSHDDHFKLGIEIGKVFDIVFLTDDNHFKALSAGIAQSNKKCKVFIASPAKIIDYVNKKCGREDVVIFEGSKSRMGLSHIKKEPVY